MGCNKKPAYTINNKALDECNSRLQTSRSWANRSFSLNLSHDLQANGKEILTGLPSHGHGTRITIQMVNLAPFR